MRYAVTIWIAGTKRSPQHLLHAIDQPRHIDRLRSQFLAAGEGEHALGQRGAAVGALHRAIDQTQQARIVRQSFAQKLQVAEDHHQQIVEVVRDAAGELAEALQLLHLVHLRECRLALARALLDALLQFGVGLREFRGALRHATLQLDVELLELARLAVQVGEDPHLGAQQFRHHGHRHIIDRTRLIAAQQIQLAHLDRRDEDDRGAPAARMFADHRRQLEAIEVRHDDIDQHDGDLVSQQVLQRLVGRVRLDEVLAELGKDHLIAHQLGRLVVDQQDVDRLARAHGRRPQRCSQMRSADSNCSVLTGLAR